MKYPDPAERGRERERERERETETSKRLKGLKPDMLIDSSLGIRHCPFCFQASGRCSLQKLQLFEISWGPSPPNLWFPQMTFPSPTQRSARRLHPFNHAAPPAWTQELGGEGLGFYGFLGAGVDVTNYPASILQQTWMWFPHA